MPKAVAKAKTVGRPTVVTPEATDEICARLIGGEGLKAICQSEHLPARSTVYQHMVDDDELRTRIARAREAQQDAMVDDTVDLADEATPENVHVVKLRIWARQWRAAKLAPKKYGDSVNLKHSDPDGGPVQINDVQRAARIAALLEAVRGRLPQD